MGVLEETIYRLAKFFVAKSLGLNRLLICLKKYLQNNNLMIGNTPRRKFKLSY